MIEYGHGNFRYGWPSADIRWTAGRIAVTTDSGHLWCFDSDTGAPLQIDAVERTRNSIYAFSPDGKHLAVGDGDSVAVESLGFGVDVEGVSSIEWAPDGTRLAVGTDLGKSGRVWIFDLDGTGVVELKGARGAVEDVRFSNESTRIMGRTMSTAYVWEASGGKAMTLLKGKRFVRLAGWNGPHPVVVDGGLSVSAFDANDGSVLWSHKGGGNAVAGDHAVLSMRFGVVDVIVDGAIVASPEIPLSGPEIALDPHGGRAAFAGKRVLVAEIDALETMEPPATAGHSSQINAVAEHDGHFATVAGDDAVTLWKRGQTAAVARIPTDRFQVTNAVALGDNRLWVGSGTRLLAFDWNGTALAESPELSKDVVVTRRCGDGLVVVTQTHRSSYGQVLILDPETLEIRFECAATQRFERAIDHDGALRLLSGQAYADLDMSGALGEAVPAASLGVSSGAASAFPGYRLQHQSSAETVAVLEVEDNVATNEYPVGPSGGGLYLSNDSAVLLVPSADRLSFFTPTTGAALGSYAIDRQVNFVHEFDDGGLLVSALDGWLAELPAVAEMVAAA